MLPDQYIKKILTANVYSVAVETPLEYAPKLSKRLGNEVLLKREDKQPVFSFKLRGAFNKMSQLTSEERARGVVCASAGNHAQGVAMAARELGMVATIVMPLTTPEIKICAVRALGATVILEGLSYDEASDYAQSLARHDGPIAVHPFDDPAVIAGQGTVGVEIARQCGQCGQTGSAPDVVFVPVGGGGLIAGVSVYLKHLYPEVRIVGVEPTESPTLHTALSAGKPVKLDRVGIFADGVSVRQVGKETFRLCQQYVDEVVLVSGDEICAAIQDIYSDTRAITEPAGALAVAGIKAYVANKGLQGKRLVAINSGANMGFDRLAHVVERANLGQQNEALLSVQIPERKGAFLQFCQALGARSVTEFNYRMSSTSSNAQIFVGVALREGKPEAQRLQDSLVTAGYDVSDLSDNELAKTHIRHMVGGPAHPSSSSLAAPERLIRFEFPEHPGALLSFLQSIGSRWNISLFHYRNHGSDFGRVLAGVQVTEADHTTFMQHLGDLGYAYWDETDNLACRLFLGG